MKILFSWNYNGNTIKIGGNFNNWNLIDMPNKQIELDLDYGIYEYKFLVDNVWCYDILKPNIINEYGSRNNIISVNDGNIQIVHISDTHSKFPNLQPSEILIHTGDFSIDGHPGEYEQFNDWIGRQKFLYKIVILGNHDLDYTLRENKNPLENAKKKLSNCIVLNFESINLYGYNFFGIPWFDFHNWNYTYKYNLTDELKNINEFDIIPKNTDILMTHGPPSSKKLLHIINIIQPKYHLFGHIHHQYGIIIKNWFNNNKTIFINSSLVDEPGEKIINQPHYINLKIIS
jgi:Icc-related predicted phosphoesterase